MESVVENQKMLTDHIEWLIAKVNYFQDIFDAIYPRNEFGLTEMEAQKLHDIHDFLRESPGAEFSPWFLKREEVLRESNQSTQPQWAEPPSPPARSYEGEI